MTHARPHRWTGRAAPLLLCAALAGCAFLRPAFHDPRLNSELAQLAGLALATAESDEDIRQVLRRKFEAPGRRGRYVLIGGHLFVLVPATLDRMEASSRWRTLVAQSLELSEPTCLAFSPEGAPLEFRAVAGGRGSVTLSASAEGVRFINVGIQLEDGCIVAVHFEQASAQRAD